MHPFKRLSIVLPIVALLTLSSCELISGFLHPELPESKPTVSMVNFDFQNVKKQYRLGEEFSSEGISLCIKYSDDSVKTITQGITTDYDGKTLNEAGDLLVKAQYYYEETQETYEDRFHIDVNDYIVSFYIQPSESVYYHYLDDPFYFTEKPTVVYASGTEREVYSDLNFSINNTPLYEGDVVPGNGVIEIEVEYNGFKAKYNYYNRYSITYVVDEKVLNSESYENKNPNTYSPVNKSNYNVTLTDASSNEYNFIGWYDNPEFNGEKITEVDRTQNKNLTFYAKFVKGKINYVLNGGVLEDGDWYEVGRWSTKLPGEPDVHRDGYKFSGWFLSEDFSGYSKNYISFSECTEENYSVTLYAKWYASTWNIEYDCDGGSISSGYFTYYRTGDEKDLPTAQKTGYTFLGWVIINSDGSEGERITSVAGRYGNLKLKAVFANATYSISYVLNGGTNNQSNYNEYYKEAAFNLYDPTRTGYVFCGWYESEDFSGSAVTVIAKGSEGNKTFYAKWEAEVYTITYDYSEGALTSGTNAATYTVENTVTFLNPVRSGYEFLGYVLVNDSGYEISGSYINSTAGLTGNIKLKAKWSSTEFRIYYYYVEADENSPENPSTYVKGTAVTLHNPSRDYYTFAGWYDNNAFTGDAITVIPSDATGAKILYAKWTPCTYTVTYHVNQEDVDNSGNLTSYTYSQGLSLGNLSKNGYVFLGWYDNEGFEGDRLFAISSTTHGDVELWAKWQKGVYSVSYVLNGGTNASDRVTSYTFEGEVKTLKDPSRDYYNFAGWYEDADFTGSAVTEISSGSYGNKTYYAKWTPVEYTITYLNYKGDAAFGEDIDNSMNPSTYTIETETFTLQAPSRTGYTFNTWYRKSGPSYVKQDTVTISKGSHGDVVYCAKFDAISYDIEYVLNGGELDRYSDLTYTIEEFISLYPPSRSGYEFEGWFDNEEFNGYEVLTFGPGVTGNKKFYAKWSISHNTVYTVKIMVNKLGTTDEYERYASYTLTGTTFETTNVTVPEASKYPGLTYNSSKGIEQKEIAADETTVVEIYYTRNIITLTFDLGGGTSSSLTGSTLTGEFGAALSIENPVRTGYSFVGWSPRLPNKIPSSDTTYTAQWQSTTGNVTVTLPASDSHGITLRDWSASYTNTVYLTADTGYTTYKWYVDGVLAVGYNSYTYEAYKSSFTDGAHEILVVAEKDGKYYSARAVVEVKFN